jgi:hypothetical protein
MKTESIVRLALVQLLIALFLQGCATAPNVRSDYDKSADFGKFRTYNFVSRPSTDKAGYSSLTTQQLEAAVNAEMQRRGYTLSENPDLLINFSGKLRDKQDIVSTPGPYYGYRAGMYGAWPGYTNDVYTVNYTEGTLNIDMVDAARKQMVWEGVGVGEVSKSDMQNREATINRAVADIFMKFPFRAGESQPISTASK